MPMTMRQKTLETVGRLMERQIKIEETKIKSIRKIVRGK